MSKVYIKSKFGQTPNELLNDKNVSLKAKGLYGFIQSKPDGWDFSADRIAHQCKEGVSSVKQGLKELENAGYLVRSKWQNKKGHWQIDYILQIYSDKIPAVENPPSENPPSENPPSENRTNNSKKDNSKKDIVKKKVDKSTPLKSKSIYHLKKEDALKQLEGDEKLQFRIAKSLNTFFAKYQEQNGNKIKQHIKNAKVANEMKPIELLLKDYSEQQIKKVIRWFYDGKTQDARFWQMNIQSCKKFREKFETMNLVMKNPKHKEQRL